MSVQNLIDNARHSLKLYENRNLMQVNCAKSSILGRQSTYRKFNTLRDIQQSKDEEESSSPINHNQSD